MPRMSFAEISEDCLGFVRSLLCSDSSLQVFYSNERPYRWVLSYPFEGRRVSDRTGLLVFNYLGVGACALFRTSNCYRVSTPREEMSVVPAA